MGETPNAIVLNIEPRVYAAGEVLTGTVSLNLEIADQEKVDEVHVKLKGDAVSEIRLEERTADPEHRENERLERDHFELVHESISLWRRGNNTPGAYEPVILLPFSFQLPSMLPPTFEHRGLGRNGSVTYSVEAVGERHGLKWDERDEKPLNVMPPTEGGFQLRQALLSGWTGGWRSWIVEDKIRRGILGEHASVKAELLLPAIDQLPLFTPIPYVLKIVTITKHMKQKDKDPSEVIFPAPPNNPKDVELELHKNVQLIARSHERHDDDNVANIGGIGGDPGMGESPNEWGTHVAVAVAPLTWIAGDHEHGQWLQQVEFRSTIQFTCPPSFHFRTANLDYYLHVKVPFPGMGNSLRKDVPVNLVYGSPYSAQHTYPSATPGGSWGWNPNVAQQPQYQ